MKIVSSEFSVPKSGALVLGVVEGCQLTSIGIEIDRLLSGELVKGISTNPSFTGKKNTSLILNGMVGLDISRIILVGLGNPADISKLQMQGMGATAVSAVNKARDELAGIVIERPNNSPITTEEMVSEVGLGARLAAYRFDKYRTQIKDKEKPSLKTLTLMSEGISTYEKAFLELQHVADGVYLTRDLVSEPSNIKYPSAIVKDIESLTSIGVDVELLSEKRMEELGMGAILGVGQGSRRDSYIAIMQWNGSPKKDDKPLAFVGKGVTFDTGGISIKPSGGMEEMKYDMAGAGTVIGLMRALAGRKACANVVGVVGLVENMPDGNAQRPGDVVTTMSGQTIEVINTDAEGRLVLSDALWYTQKTFSPRFMVDLATLTGAIIVSLGTYQAGLFSNDDELSNRLIAAGKASGEEVWRLPMGARYDRDINSEIADMKNVGKGREAGSITAAQLLERFVGETPWAHLDIAGMAWMKRGDDPSVPKGASGFGVRLLNQLVRDHYEA